MEDLCRKDDGFGTKLPLLNIKKRNIIKPSINPLLSAYLSEEVLNDIKLSNDDNFTSKMGKISNVWTSSIRRERFKHLSDNPVCVCGAGNDLQFLHDNMETRPVISDIAIISDKDKRRGKKQEDKSIMKIPENLVPAEFNLVFHHGSNSIELHDGNHGTQPLFHKCHKITLPVMNPNNKSESRKIYQSLRKILEESGLYVDIDPQLPTSLHRLLQLAKKEQDLYNVVFHSIIKQTTVDCVDRGELLANIRQRYRNIFVSVPQKIKEFHDFVIAQRILDRRLTEELTRFQKNVAGLSSELSGVKNHENLISQMCHETKDKLKQAVEETKKNADLLREYHGLYEQQRNRLEKSSAQLNSERDCWRDASYKLTEKVLNHYSMESGIMIVNMERQWLSLSSYFMDILTKTDVQILTIVKSKANDWSEEAQRFSLNLVLRDNNVRIMLEKEIEKINNLKEDFEDFYLTKQGQLIRPLDRDETMKIFKSISGWEKTMSYLSELFGGQSMSLEEEKLTRLKKLCYDYTDLAIEVFNRHRHESDRSLYEEHKTLLELNKVIEEMMNRFTDQLTGDNGVADGITTLQTYLENWIARLNNNLSDSFFRPLPDSEWIRFKLVMDDWVGLLCESRNAIGTIRAAATDGDSKKKYEVLEIIQSVENWSQRSFSGIESENLKLREAIINLQRNMIRWTAQIIIRLAPDFPSNSPEAKRAARTASIGIKELQEKAEILHENINKLTNYIIDCSKDIVVKLIQYKIDTQCEFPDEDNFKLQQLLESAKNWINCSQDILKAMLEAEYSSQKSVSEQTYEKNDILETEPSKETTEPDMDEGEMNVSDMIGGLLESSLFNFENIDDEKPIEVIPQAPIVFGVGVDDNVHAQMLVQDPDQPYVGNKFKNHILSDPDLHLPDTKEAYLLIQISQFLQTKLRISNNVAIEAENDFTKIELDLTRSKLYLNSIQERCTKMTVEIEELKTEKSLILATPALLSSTNVLERQVSATTEKSSTSKSVANSRHRAPRHNKKKK